MISPMKLTLLLAAITAIFYPPNLPAQTGSPSANLTVTVIHQVPDWGTYRHDPAPPEPSHLQLYFRIQVACNPSLFVGNGRCRRTLLNLLKLRQS